MKIYLAARYSMRAEMLEFAKCLTRLGHETTSRWIYGDHDGRENAENSARFAAEDMEDLDRADCLIQFVIDKRAPSRGGNHVEFGYALAANKILIVVGNRSHVFHWLPQVNYFCHPGYCLTALAPKAEKENCCDANRTPATGPATQEPDARNEDGIRAAGIAGAGAAGLVSHAAGLQVRIENGAAVLTAEELVNPHEFADWDF